MPPLEHGADCFPPVIWSGSEQFAELKTDFILIRWLTPSCSDFDRKKNRADLTRCAEDILRQ